MSREEPSEAHWLEPSPAAGTPPVLEGESSTSSGLDLGALSRSGSISGGPSSARTSRRSSNSRSQHYGHQPHLHSYSRPQRHSQSNVLLTTLQDKFPYTHHLQDSRLSSALSIGTGHAPVSAAFEGLETNTDPTKAAEPLPHTLATASAAHFPISDSQLQTQHSRAVKPPHPESESGPTTGGYVPPISGFSFAPWPPFVAADAASLGLGGSAVNISEMGRRDTNFSGTGYRAQPTAKPPRTSLAPNVLSSVPEGPTSMHSIQPPSYPLHPFGSSTSTSTLNSSFAPPPPQSSSDSGPRPRHHSTPQPSARRHAQPDHLRVSRRQCPQCFKVFSSMTAVQVHALVHSGDKPFHCPHAGCNKTFNVKSNMMRHYKLHIKEPANEASELPKEQDPRRESA
ncbi:LADA_0G11848g1_1 [Lachancea dasiensis]|uniref:LADA_0G11848g1_1 n=1 Tax=Lachancea dasiensis TaxID=1072105 RepID=A0A1G4JV21_9SACH|nr:LADA_0G11848g1_1 [Lachancea dasiensis]